MQKQLSFVALDVVVAAVGIELTALVVRLWVHPAAEIGFGGTTITALGGLLTAVVGAYLTGLDDPARLPDRSAVILRGMAVGVLTSVVMLVVSHALWLQGLGRILLVATGLVVGSAIVGWRLIYARFLQRGPRIPVVVVGDGSAERRFAEALRSLHHTRYAVVGLLHDEEPSGYRRPAVSWPGEAAWPVPTTQLPVLGELARADEILPDRGVAHVIVLDTAPMSDERIAVLSRLQARGIRVCTAGTVWMNGARRLPPDLVDARWLLAAFEHMDRPMVRELKRLVDIGVGAAAMAVFLAMLPVLYPLVRLGSRGPFLYSQPRVGLRGRVFHIYKIRTMAQQANDAPQRWTQVGDARITRVGRVLRFLRIDEMPQLYNVLRGDMSLVGPRPEQPTIVSRLSERIAFFDYRHLIKPGITGWAQINQGYVSTTEDWALRLSYDLYYVERHSLAMDLDIILRTIFVMAAGIGSR
ncbi:MAG: exopolysaccharide biosynthesis polyprenyl glycosylphosphotransferase [Myxococcales bacterium]|nr:exopolysaccharide biosynthesis polyprenyl glycosylphosphotransferase [Myxococcales bacterium]